MLFLYVVFKKKKKKKKEGDKRGTQVRPDRSRWPVCSHDAGRGERDFGAGQDLRAVDGQVWVPGLREGTGRGARRLGRGRSRAEKGADR